MDVEAGVKIPENNQNVSELPAECIVNIPPIMVEENTTFRDQQETRDQENASNQAAVIISEVSENTETIGTTVEIQSASAPIPNSKRYYPGDVVVKKIGDINPVEWRPMFGTVMRSLYDKETSKGHDQGRSAGLQVHWDVPPIVEMMKVSDVALVDRVLLRGQRIQNLNGDIGTVMDYKISATVQINGTSHIVERVPLQRLHPISPHVRGQEVLLNGWVGIITTIKRNVWFRMDGGLVFFVEAIESDGFTRTDPYWGLGVACPGMRTRLPNAAMKSAVWASSTLKFISRWLPIHYLYTWAFSTIIRTEVTGLEVKWLQPAPGPQNANLPQPPKAVARRELKQLLAIGTPSTETIGINSVRKLKILPNDQMTNYDVWMDGFKKKFVDENESVQYATTNPGVTPPLNALLGSGDDQTPVRVVLRHNLVTVEWENGTVEKIPAVKIPMIAPTADDGEFPMGLVVAPVQKDSANSSKYGIVMESNQLAKSRSRKVNIRWMNKGNDEGISEVSVFDIRPHKTYSMYIRGTIVFPRETSASFQSGVVTDVNIGKGTMVIVKSSDNLNMEVHPHQVIAIEKRCHWSFFSRAWLIDDLILPPYQLELDYDPSTKQVDVAEQNYNVLSADPNNPQEQANSATLWDEPSFELIGFAPETHRYHKSYEDFGLGFSKKVEREWEILKEKVNIPEGIWIKSYENRLDLLSVLMVGPIKTPYEDGLFLFDVQLPVNFPTTRPKVHFVSYTMEIHPLLSFDGNVCVSSIPWKVPDQLDPEVSYIALFLSRLQATLFTPNPYFADGTKKSELNSERGRIKSRLYNQGVFIRVIDSAWNMLQNPHYPWAKSIRNHFASLLPEKLCSIEKWLNATDSESADEDFPAYPLLPVPEGMRIALSDRMDKFKKLVRDVESETPAGEIQSVTDTTADSESYPVSKNVDNVDLSRMLTPIAEITEPSSTSTFGGKQSNISMPLTPGDPEHLPSLDSMKNVRPSTPTKRLASTSETEESETDRASSEIAAD